MTSLQIILDILRALTSGALCFKFLCAIDLTQRLSNWKQVSANFMSHAVLLLKYQFPWSHLIKKYTNKHRTLKKEWKNEKIASPRWVGMGLEPKFCPWRKQFRMMVANVIMLSGEVGMFAHVMLQSVRSVNSFICDILDTLSNPCLQSNRTCC